MLEMEIVNPSDRAYIDVEDKEAACLAVIAVLGVQYGIKDTMPVFMFAPKSQVDEWWEKKFGHIIDDGIQIVSKERIVKALKSTRLENKKTSVNDFVGHCHEVAQKIEKETGQC